MGQNSRTVALSNDYLAIIDRGDPKMVRIVDVTSGKLTQNTINHNLEVLEIGISQYGPAMDRKIYVLDRSASHPPPAARPAPPRHECAA